MNLPSLRRLGLTTTALILLACEVALFSGPKLALANPATTLSRYTGGTGATTTTDFYNLGCNRAGGPVGLVVLAFGRPKYDATYGWGTDPPGSVTYWSNAEVLARAKQFASGVYYCRTASTNIAMIIGTSNDNSGGGVQSAVGASWAAMVKDAQTWIIGGGTSFAPWVNAYAGPRG